jgi:hypothetical protein
MSFLFESVESGAVRGRYSAIDLGRGYSALIVAGWQDEPAP